MIFLIPKDIEENRGRSFKALKTVSCLQKRVPEENFQQVKQEQQIAELKLKLLFVIFSLKPAIILFFQWQQLMYHEISCFFITLALSRSLSPPSFSLILSPLFLLFLSRTFSLPLSHILSHFFALSLSLIHSFFLFSLPLSLSSLSLINIYLIFSLLSVYIFFISGPVSLLFHLLLYTGFLKRNVPAFCSYFFYFPSVCVFPAQDCVSASVRQCVRLAPFREKQRFTLKRNFSGCYAVVAAALQHPPVFLLSYKSNTDWCQTRSHIIYLLLSTYLTNLP